MATLHLPMAESARAIPANAFFEDAVANVKSLPGVVDAAAISGLFSDYTPNTDVIADSAAVQTAPSTAAVVSESFFQTMAIPLLAGRLFSKFDAPDHPPAVVINKTMADQFWPGQSPIGRRFRYGSPGSIGAEWLTVVGVVGDMNPYGPGSKVISSFYRPYRQAPWPPSMDIVIRCKTATCALLADPVRRAIQSADRQIPHFAVQPVSGILDQISASRRFDTWLLTAFSFAALCLAFAGIYALLSYLVSQRTQEIGLRMALGATARDVASLVLSSGIKLALTGIGLGLVASMFFMQLLRHLLFETATNDPLTMLTVSIVLLAAAIAASYFPVRKAAQLDPLVSIRHE